MAIREILEVPDPRLKTVSVPVEPEEFNDELKTLVDELEQRLDTQQQIIDLCNAESRHLRGG